MKEITKPLLSVADVLQFCADNLRKQEADMRLIAIIHDVIKDKPGMMDDAPPAVRAAMVQPERQGKALHETIEILSALAIEHRIHDVRNAERTITNGEPA